MKRLISIILCTTGSLTLTGCMTGPAPTQDLIRIRDVDVKSQKAFSISGIRYTGLRDAALSIGARGGLAARSQQINAEVITHTKTLDRIFNFNPMLLDNHVLPPILIEGRNQLEQSNDETLRISDRAYTIVAQAKFVTAVPTWRDYLILNYDIPELPDRSLLPRNSTEKKVWDHYIEEGWRAGNMQADSIILENIGRLKRDYSGMVLYRTLLAQNMVSEPYVAKVELGVTGNSNEMAINDRMLRITAKPEFIQESSSWKAEIASR